ncbi:hypothetical protein [Halorubrum salsamenti]|nr:hypothetical protein [Halorubrum salsamenti]
MVRLAAGSAAAENGEERAIDDRLSAPTSSLWDVRNAFGSDDQARCATLR